MFKVLQAAVIEVAQKHAGLWVDLHIWIPS